MLYALLSFLIISTFFPTNSYVGKLGLVVGETNRGLFGYISFVYLFLFIKPIWYVKSLDFCPYKLAEKILSIIILTYSMTLIQALFVDTKMAGIVGSFSITIIGAYIGSFGIFILSLITFF